MNWRRLNIYKISAKKSFADIHASFLFRYVIKAKTTVTLQIKPNMKSKSIYSKISACKHTYSETDLLLERPRFQQKVMAGETHRPQLSCFESTS